MDDRLDRLIRSAFRKAGRRYAEARNAYREGRMDQDGSDGWVDPATFDLPADDEGRTRLVCRRHVERRAVRVDAEGHPACFEADHPDCEGCAEDVREGCVETW